MDLRIIRAAVAAPAVAIAFFAGTAGASNSPSTITFDPVTTTALKLDMTSAAPYDPTTGNLAISELHVN